MRVISNTKLSKEAEGDGEMMTYERDVEEEGNEVSNPGAVTEVTVDPCPSHASDTGRRNEQEENRVQLLGEGLVGRKPLVQGNK